MLFLKGVLLIIFGLLFCLPLTLRLLPPQDRSILQVFSTSFGVSIGFLTLLMAYIATFYKPLFNVYGIVFPVSVFSLFHFALMLRNWDTLKSSEKVNSSSLEYLLKGSVLFICILIFWNSIYYLFVTQNAITHYAMPAKNIFLAGGMDGFHVPQFKGPYDAYPLLVPLSYVYNYFAFGEINEHAAKVIPGLFSIGVIGSTYLLGKHLCNKKTGLFAALLLSFTPLFLRFATSGYTDIPGAFFYTNSILYYWLTYRYRSMKYAILTGLMVGFSIWTKNSTLLIFISILLFFIIQTLFDRLRKTEGHIHLHHLAVILGISLAIGGPWYLRNYLLYGYLVPVRLIVPGNWRYETFWMHYGVPLFKYFGAIGYHVSIVYVFGLFYSFSRLFWKDRKILFLLSFVLPYLIVWVLKFSYDPRFLLTILPLFAVLGIWAVGEGFQRILGSLSRRELTTFILCGILIVPHVAT